MTNGGRIGCKWCQETYSGMSELFGHQVWSHNQELTDATTRPLYQALRSHNAPHCKACQLRLQMIEKGAQRGLRTSEIFGVTAPTGETREGHRMYYSPLGELTLCQARSLVLPVWAQKKPLEKEETAS